MFIKGTSIEFIREPLAHALGFKGYHGSKPHKSWQGVVGLESEEHQGVGLNIQSPLWSDMRVFKENGLNGAHVIMYAMTNYALKLAENKNFDTPDALLDALLPHVHQYGRRISGVDDMNLTFALNSLVAMDFAAWVLYAREKGLTTFDQLIPAPARKAMQFLHSRVGRIPLISYNKAQEDIEALVENKDFLLKIKIGSNPDQDNDSKKMLISDKKRISQVHAIAGDMQTPYTDCGKVLYYLDANSRYISKNMIMDLLEHADKIGMLNRIVVLEEPFAEELDIEVGDIPVPIAADESAHDVDSVIRRIDMGYSVIALKPIAKTLSMSFRMLAAAYERNVACFCADLTVNPIMIEWNKNFACRLSPLPGVKIAAFESNGHQNYKNWSTMETYHPCYGQSFTQVVDGCYSLDASFYHNSGGILMDYPHYNSLLRNNKL